MDFYADKFQRGQPAELILLELCKSRGLHVELNPAPESDLEGRRGWDIAINDIPYEVKSDWYSWKSHNLCVEGNALRHTRSSFFIYMLPRPSSVYFHVFPVRRLIELYNAKARVARGDGTFRETFLYTHKVVGDQATNHAVILPEEIMKSEGEPLWAATKSLM